MQLGLKKHLQPHEIKLYKHKIKNQTNKDRKQFAIHKVHIVSLRKRVGQSS